jgi:hypothetical protein
MSVYKCEQKAQYRRGAHRPTTGLVSRVRPGPRRVFFTNWARTPLAWRAPRTSRWNSLCAMRQGAIRARCFSRARLFKSVGVNTRRRWPTKRDWDRVSFPPSPHFSIFGQHQGGRGFWPKAGRRFGRSVPIKLDRPEVWSSDAAYRAAESPKWLQLSGAAKLTTRGDS